MLKAAKQADLALDDNLQMQIKQTLGEEALNGGGGKKKRRADSTEESSGNVAPIDVFDDDDFGGARRKEKGLSKVQQLRNKYETLKQKEHFSKKFSNSSFITPEAASYLNELIKTKQSKADLEIVYAGQHSENVPTPKFKRKEKYTSRYKKRRRR